jgi:uncharacterized protein (DUF488 family)
MGEGDLEQTAGAELYTIGYEGRAVEDFVEDLRFADVEVLVDVRELPQSRKPGFSKSKLSEYVSRAGVQYLHLRSLGSPRDSRRRLRESGDFDAFSREYADHLEVNAEDVYALVELINSGRRAAIMCFERDHTRCHRSLLVSVLLGEAGHDFRVYHL